MKMAVDQLTTQRCLTEHSCVISALELARWTCKRRNILPNSLLIWFSNIVRVSKEVERCKRSISESLFSGPEGSSRIEARGPRL